MHLDMAEPQPWKFETWNVRKMIGSALETALRAELDNKSDGVSESEVLVAVNDLRHAADELERSLLEKKFGYKR